MHVAGFDEATFVHIEINRSSEITIKEDFFHACRGGTLMRCICVEMACVRVNINKSSGINCLDII